MEADMYSSCRKMNSFRAKCDKAIQRGVIDVPTFLLHKILFYDCYTRIIPISIENAVFYRKIVILLLLKDKNVMMVSAETNINSSRWMCLILP